MKFHPNPTDEELKLLWKLTRPLLIEESEPEPTKEELELLWGFFLEAQEEEGFEPSWGWLLEAQEEKATGAKELEK